MKKEKKEKIVKNLDSDYEGAELCEKCGTEMILEEGEKICPDCDTEIEFFGEKDA